MKDETGNAPLSARKPSQQANAAIQLSRDLVARLIGANGDSLAPDADFTTVSALANHYHMDRKDFMALLDRHGIRRRADGAPSDMALRADAARLNALSPYDAEKSGKETYWRWHRTRIHAFLLSTGAMGTVIEAQRERAQDVFNFGYAVLKHEALKAMNAGVEALRRALAGKSEAEILERAMALKKLSSKARRDLDKLVAAEGKPLMPESSRAHMTLSFAKAILRSCELQAEVSAAAPSPQGPLTGESAPH